MSANGGPVRPDPIALSERKPGGADSDAGRVWCECNKAPDYTDSNGPPTTTITDSAGRTLVCYLEAEVVVDGTTYGLLTPVDTPVALVRINESDGEDEILEDYGNYEDVLSKFDSRFKLQNLKIIRSAAILTVAGEIPFSEQDQGNEDEPEDGEGYVHEWLATTEGADGRAYHLYIPLECSFIVARACGFTGELVEGDELERIQPGIERALEALA